MSNLVLLQFPYHLGMMSMEVGIEDNIVDGLSFKL